MRGVYGVVSKRMDGGEREYEKMKEREKMKYGMKVGSRRYKDLSDGDLLKRWKKLNYGRHVLMVCSAVAG